MPVSKSPRLNAFRQYLLATVRMARLGRRPLSVSREQASPGLAALTLAALALPGIIPAIATGSETDFVSLQVGQYQEGERDILGLKSKYDPIVADTLSASAGYSVSDDMSLVLNVMQDTWSGATPVATAPAEMQSNGILFIHGVSGASPYIISGGNVFLDRATLKPLLTDGFGTVVGGPNERNVHTLSGASPETRQQADAKVTKTWDNTSLSIGGGLSSERDYVSRFGNIGGTWDFNQKRTTLSAGMSYTDSTIKATLDHDATPYIYDACAFLCPASDSGSDISTPGDLGKRVLHGKRKDLTAHVGLTQVLTPSTLLEIGAGFTRSTGYLSNPYKVVEVAFIDPDQQFLAPDPSTQYYVNFNALLEKRPTERNQGVMDLKLVQHIEATDASVHLGYRYFQDDWGIKAHTFDADWAQPLGGGWTLTPSVRFYSQNEANFYTPWLVTNQAATPAILDPVRGQIYLNGNTPNDGNTYFDAPTLSNPLGFNPYTGNPVVDAQGNPVSQEIADQLIAAQTTMDRKLLPNHYSSDHRLSAYGALSAGLTVTRAFHNGMLLELGYEHYDHAGRLKLGGGGEADFADFTYDMFNATLRFPLGGVAATATDHSDHDMSEMGEAGDRHNGMSTGGHNAPAGVMLAHMLPEGEFMAAYHHMYDQQSGSMRHGAHSISDLQVKSDGCLGDLCLLRPGRMTMHTHMAELMYAPSNWLTLMAMSQYVNKSMSMEGLLTNDDLAAIGPDQGHMYFHHVVHEHESGGFGDTQLHALVRLYEDPTHHLHAGIGLSVPTGSSRLQLRDNHQIHAGFMDYGMQLGSGTWDLRPSLTYTGQSGRVSWGAQINGTLRLQDRNGSGYRLGNGLEATAWGGYAVNNWLSTTVRVVHARQGEIKGEYNNTFFKLGPQDFPVNYGGKTIDVGIGLSAELPSGIMKSSKVSVEWLQPVVDEPNGYQAERKGSLVATWSTTF